MRKLKRWVKKIEMEKLSPILIFLLLNCSGSKEFDEWPTPIGGDIRVQEVFIQELGSDYYKIDAKFLIFSVMINEEGKIIYVSMVGGGSNPRIYDKLEKAMIDHIKFTPATKDGKRVKAGFKYTFYYP